MNERNIPPKQNQKTTGPIAEHRARVCQQPLASRWMGLHPLVKTKSSPIYNFLEVGHCAHVIQPNTSDFDSLFPQPHANFFLKRAICPICCLIALVNARTCCFSSSSSVPICTSFASRTAPSCAATSSATDLINTRSSQKAISSTLGQQHHDQRSKIP